MSNNHIHSSNCPAANVAKKYKDFFHDLLKPSLRTFPWYILHPQGNAHGPNHDKVKVNNDYIVVQIKFLQHKNVLFYYGIGRKGKGAN